MKVDKEKLDEIVVRILDKIEECARISLTLDKLPQSYDEYILQKSADQTRSFLQQLLGLPNYPRNIVQNEVKRLKELFV